MAPKRAADVSTDGPVAKRQRVEDVDTDVLDDEEMELEAEAQASDITVVDPVCLCETDPVEGSMIQCSEPTCQIGQFHLSCVDLEDLPSGPWKCVLCSDGQFPDNVVVAPMPALGSLSPAVLQHDRWMSAILFSLVWEIMTLSADSPFDDRNECFVARTVWLLVRRFFKNESHIRRWIDQILPYMNGKERLGASVWDRTTLDDLPNAEDCTGAVVYNIHGSKGSVGLNYGGMTGNWQVRKGQHNALLRKGLDQLAKLKRVLFVYKQRAVLGLTMQKSIRLSFDAIKTIKSKVLRDLSLVLVETAVMIYDDLIPLDCDDSFQHGRAGSELLIRIRPRDMPSSFFSGANRALSVRQGFRYVSTLRVDTKRGFECWTAMAARSNLPDNYVGSGQHMRDAFVLYRQRNGQQTWSSFRAMMGRWHAETKQSRDMITTDTWWKTHLREKFHTVIAKICSSWDPAASREERIAHALAKFKLSDTGAGGRQGIDCSPDTFERAMLIVLSLNTKVLLGILDISDHALQTRLESFLNTPKATDYAKASAVRREVYKFLHPVAPVVYSAKPTNVRKCTLCGLVDKQSRFIAHLDRYLRDDKPRFDFQHPRADVQAFRDTIVAAAPTGKDKRAPRVQVMSSIGNKTGRRKTDAVPITVSLGESFLDDTPLAPPIVARTADTAALKHSALRKQRKPHVHAHVLAAVPEFTSDPIEESDSTQDSDDPGRRVLASVRASRLNAQPVRSKAGDINAFFSPAAAASIPQLDNTHNESDLEFEDDLAASVELSSPFVPGSSASASASSFSGSPVSDKDLEIPVFDSDGIPQSPSLPAGLALDSDTDFGSLGFDSDYGTDVDMDSAAEDLTADQDRCFRQTRVSDCDSVDLASRAADDVDAPFLDFTALHNPSDVHQAMRNLVQRQDALTPAQPMSTRAAPSLAEAYLGIQRAALRQATAAMTTGSSSPVPTQAPRNLAEAWNNLRRHLDS